MNKHLVACALSCAVVCALGATSRAQSSHDQAKQHFLLGVQLFARGDLAHALPEFEGSYQLHAVPEVLFNIALTQKGLHRYADALRSLARFEDEAAARPAGLSPKRRADADRLIAELKTQLGGLVLSVSPATASVRLDGHDALGAAPIVYLDPGRHRLEISAAGYVAEHRELDVASGMTMRLSVQLAHEPVARAPVAPAVVASPPAAAAPPPVVLAPPPVVLAPPAPLVTQERFVATRRGKATIALAALGGALLVSAAALGGDALSLRSDYHASCAPSGCNDALYRRGHDTAIATDTMIALGSATALAAIITAVAPHHARSFALAPTSTGATLTFAGAF